MKKNLLILVVMLVLFVGFNGCRPCDKTGLSPGVEYVDKGLDKNTKGSRISEGVAKGAISEFKQYKNLIDSCAADGFLPDYEVFSIHELVEFIRMSNPETTPAYIVVRKGVFNVPNDPDNPSGEFTKVTKSIMYMTDLENNPVRTPGAEPEVLYFEELRRCPPDRNCMPSEDVQPSPGN